MTRLKLYSEHVQDTWLDAYGHLNEAYYLVPFSNATWKLQDHFGIGVDYFKETGCAIYTVETHMRYLAEVRAPAVTEIEGFIIASDPKRIWFAHEMLVEGIIRATAEFMVLHYNTRENRTAAMPDDVQIALENARLADRPNWAGRSIGFNKR